jgi:hypothetical protein
MLGHLLGKGEDKKRSKIICLEVEVPRQGVGDRIQDPHKPLGVQAGIILHN